MDAPVSRLRFVPFEIPTATSQPPEGEEWIREVKFDGYRTQLIIERRMIRAQPARAGLDRPLSRRHQGGCGDAGGQGHPRRRDGEIMDPDGVSSYSALVKAVHRRSDQIAFVAFDLLHLNGKDLRKLPLIERRETLRELLPDDEGIEFSDHFVASGKGVFEAARKMGLEGVVSKRAKAPYRSGPSSNWLKTKNYSEVELPILGIQQEVGAADHGAARQRRRPSLHRNGGGVVVTRFNRDLFGRAVELLTDPEKKRADPNMTWLKPGLVGCVRYLAGNSGLRHATVLSFWWETRL